MQEIFEMTYNVEKIVPYGSEKNKGEEVEIMFDSIAEKYDTLNHTLSMGNDFLWRKKGISMLKQLQPRTILDIATGTGDLAIQAYNILKPESILGVDISEGMMDVARKKVEKAGLSDIISFEKQDCMNLKIAGDTFDAAMVAFGVRNFENLDQGLQEILRVLKPGGKLMILELSKPNCFAMKQAYNLYSKLFIPTMGKLISKSGEAYTYLPKSIEAFIQGDEMLKVLLKNGYRTAMHKVYTMGTCSMYLAKK